MTEQRRTAPAPIVENIPAELLGLPQWVVWRLEERKGKATKVPYTPGTTDHARTNAPSTWRSFEAAYTCYLERPDYFSGIGFVFTKNDPYVGGDIDHCVTPDGAIADEALDMLPPTYAEISQSGTGAHFIARASGDYGRKTARGELYSSLRFFVMTGNVIAGYDRITHCQAAVDTFAASLGVTERDVKDGNSGSGSRADRVRQIPDADWEDGRTLLRTQINRLLARLRASAVSRKTHKDDTQLGMLLREDYRTMHERWPNAGIVRSDGSIDESQVRAMFANSIKIRRFTFPEYAALMSHFFAEQCLAKWGTKQAWREELASLWLRGRTPRANDRAAELPTAPPAPRGRAGSRTNILDRAYAVLLSFRAGTEALLAVADLADALGVHRRTASALLAALEKSGRITYQQAGQYNGITVTFPGMIYSENESADTAQPEATNGHYPDEDISATERIDHTSGVIYSGNETGDTEQQEAAEAASDESAISAEPDSPYIYIQYGTIPTVVSPKIIPENRIRNRVSLAEAVARAFDELPRDRVVEATGEQVRWPITTTRVREYVETEYSAEGWKPDAIRYWVDRIRKRRKAQTFDDLAKLKREELEKRQKAARKRIEAAERRAIDHPIPEAREWYAKRASQLGGQLALLGWEQQRRDTTDAARVEAEGYTQGEMREMLDLVEQSRRDDTAGLVARLKARKRDG